MSIDILTTVCVPGIASLAYLTAGVAHLCSRNYALALMWICYSVANICLLTAVAKK